MIPTVACLPHGGMLIPTLTLRHPESCRLYATRVCWPAGVELLIQHGASVLARTSAQDTAMHWAALKGNIDILALLLAAGGDVNAAGDVGNRPLHLAAAADHSEVCMM